VRFQIFDQRDKRLVGVLRVLAMQLDVEVMIPRIALGVSCERGGIVRSADRALQVRLRQVSDLWMPTMVPVYSGVARRSLLLFFLLVSVGFGQVMLSLESGPAEPGSTVLLNLTLSSGQTTVAGLQWTLTYLTQDIAAIQVAISPAAAAAGQTLSCTNQTAAVTCLLVSYSRATVPSGVVAVVTVTISTATSDASSAISLSNVVAASLQGEGIPIAANGAVMTINGATSSRPALRFVPVTPCRVADTRNANGPFGGPAIQRQTSRDFAVPNGDCGIPSTAAAYSLNVAVVPQQGTLRYLTVWPGGQPQPLVATLNSVDGRIKSNAAIVPAGSSGAISIYATEVTHVILDINGYFVTATDAAALAFYPVTPCRIVDTRNSNGALGGPSLRANGARSFPIQGSCGIPAAARAYSLNFAAVPSGPLGYLTVWPAGQTQPVVASLNAVTGTVTANAVIVPAGTSGAIDVFATSDTNLVIDTDGYFAAPATGGLSLYNLVPCRVLDTREPAGAQPFDGTRDVNAGETCGVAAAAKAYVFNATVVPPAALGYLTMWPQGEPQPVVATLNAVDGAVTNNMAIVPTTNGSISAYASAPTHLVLDIFGYFAP
jgi:hypothetical protein